jgi:hypothetical protein
MVLSPRQVRYQAALRPDSEFLDSKPFVKPGTHAPALTVPKPRNPTNCTKTRVAARSRINRAHRQVAVLGNRVRAAALDARDRSTLQRQTGLIMGNAGVRPLRGQVLPAFDCVRMRLVMSKSRSPIRRVQGSEGRTSAVLDWSLMAAAL